MPQAEAGLCWLSMSQLIITPGDQSDDLVLLHEIYPNFDRNQLLEAKETLDRYFDSAVSICLRLAREQNKTFIDSNNETPYGADGKVDVPLSIK